MTSRYTVVVLATGRETRMQPVRQQAMRGERTITIGRATRFRSRRTKQGKG